MARIGLSREKSRKGTPASIISSTSAAVPTFSIVLASHMFESPTMTCSRRYFSASACGSSRVLMMGLLRVVALETPPRCARHADSGRTWPPWGVCSTLPAPQINWRVTRKGSRTSEILENSPARTMR